MFSALRNRQSFFTKSIFAGADFNFVVWLAFVRIFTKFQFFSEIQAEKGIQCEAESNVKQFTGVLLIFIEVV